ncbi:low-density lipoprotein receptor 2-like [Strongylocentrotus purpuratus]|uniref:Uncharacterized protein n=1 Tax=Strongylocentrotus purpuratus TaxID=7668 RepID=A0A7M7NQ00_STRPU|nr:low-density lipoprotein receptor 2-like [Strongylocentrotus purpuratus]
MTDEGLYTTDNPCQPILVNGELMPTVPVLDQPSFPVSLKGINRHLVCKLSAPTPSTTSSPTTFESTAKIFVINADGIFVADLQADLDFTSIPSTKYPTTITYDSVEKKIYWTDRTDKRIYRADEDGGNREVVTFESTNAPEGIAIAESSRMLYSIRLVSSGKIHITSLDIGQGIAFPRNEAIFVTGVYASSTLVVDEEQGFLYWSTGGFDNIVRKLLNGSGGTETVYCSTTLNNFYMMSIDLSRDPRRIFYLDDVDERAFYMDVNQPPTMTHELTDYMHDTDFGEEEQRRIPLDMSYFNGALYWIMRVGHEGHIAVMTDYDQSNRSFDLNKPLEINEHSRMLIINASP